VQTGSAVTSKLCPAKCNERCRLLVASCRLLARAHCTSHMGTTRRIHPLGCHSHSIFAHELFYLSSSVALSRHMHLVQTPCAPHQSGQNVAKRCSNVRGSFSGRGFVEGGTATVVIQCSSNQCYCRSLFVRRRCSRIFSRRCLFRSKHCDHSGSVSKIKINN